MARNLLITLSIFWGLSSSLYAQVPAYLGHGHSEYKMSFSGELRFKDFIEPSEDSMKSVIEKQLRFLFGSMQSNAVSGAPKWDHAVTNVRWEVLPKESPSDIFEYKKNEYKVTYDYSGTVVINDGVNSEYEIFLPIDPEQIYKQSLVTIGDRTYSPCSDPTDNDEAKFWYYFNKNNFRCNLKVGEHLFTFKARLEKLEKDPGLTPDYQKLVNASGEINIHFLIGPLANVENLNPLNSWDYSARSLQLFMTLFSGFGFTGGAAWTREEIAQIYKAAKYSNSGVPYVTQFSKNYKNGRINIRFFYGPTGIKEQSSAFHYFYKDALKNASVMIYIGHAGLGKNLNHREIIDFHDGDFSFDINPTAYQIFLISSCSSYAYFNKNYLDIKETGSINVLTYGLGVEGGDIAGPIALVNAVISWASGYATPNFRNVFSSFSDRSLIGVNELKGAKKNIAPPPAISSDETPIFYGD